jgi:Pectic acid lyase
VLVGVVCMRAPARAAEDARWQRRLDAFVIALDELVARARPDGGWTFAHAPGTRVRPHTAPLRYAERLAAPFGWNDWDVVVIRSPGTPAAILALLAGYRLTGRATYLETARRAGDLLVAIQMRTGGWFSEMPVRGAASARWFAWIVRRTAIDDDVTPGAVRALLALWEATGEARYREAAERGIALLVDRQLPGGAWPLVARPRWKQWIWSDFEDRATLNDGATTQSIVTLLAAARLLGRPELTAAARRAGDWIVRVQGTAPHAAWAQQYDDADAPAPARRYERVALASWETRDALEGLLALADATGDRAYCAPLRPALEWLQASRLAAGCWARFYAFDDNAPLYFDERRQVVATPADAHQPYDWTGDFGIPDLFARVGFAPPPDDGLTARLPGDPGSCPDPAAPPFDPRAATDPRNVIAWAGRLLGALEPAPPTVCRLRSER